MPLTANEPRAFTLPTVPVKVTLPFTASASTPAALASTVLAKLTVVLVPAAASFSVVVAPLPSVTAFA